MILFSIYFIIGIGLENLVVFGLLKEAWPILIIILLHAAASFFIVYAIHQFRNAFVSYNKAIIAMLFMFVFFIPILGIIASLVLARWLCIAQSTPIPQKMKTLDLLPQIKPLRVSYGVSGLKIQLQSAKTPLDARINALKVLTTLPPSKGNILIRSILPDKQDELRLLAFKLIDAQENKIISLINKNLELLDTVDTEEQKAKIYKYLGRQYWELVYTNLIEPSMINFVLDQAISYFEKVKTPLQKDPMYWYVLGRIYLRKKKYDLAISAFDQALIYGETKYRIIPYLAEAYFYQKNYKLTKQLLSSSKFLVVTQFSQSIIEFWSKTHV